MSPGGMSRGLGDWVIGLLGIGDWFIGDWELVYWGIGNGLLGD